MRNKVNILNMKTEVLVISVAYNILKCIFRCVAFLQVTLYHIHSLTNVTLRMSRHRDQETLNQSLHFQHSSSAIPFNPFSSHLLSPPQPPIFPLNLLR